MEEIGFRETALYETPQEHTLKGGTGPAEPGSDNWYRPRILFENPIPPTLEEIKRGRERFNYFKSVWPMVVGVTKGVAAFSIEPLDPVTGKTVRDPMIIGEIDEKTGEVKRISDPESTTRRFIDLVNKRLKELGPEHVSARNYELSYRESSFDKNLSLTPTFPKLA